MKKMSVAELKVKKRSWGKTRRREKVVVINREEIEETLQNFAKECRESKSKIQLTSQQNHEKSGCVVPVGMDLQQPELMSNERLIEALKRIKVPIPVYADGSPSRERLLYLYKTNVLPRPQRNKQQWGRRGRRRRGRSNGDGAGGWGGEEGGEMDTGGDWFTDGSGGSCTSLRIKRYINASRELVKGLFTIQ